MQRQPNTHILFVRLYLSESPGAGIEHMQSYEAVPVNLASNHEAEELFQEIMQCVRRWQAPADLPPDVSKRASAP